MPIERFSGVHVLYLSNPRENHLATTKESLAHGGQLRSYRAPAQKNSPALNNEFLVLNLGPGFHLGDTFIPATVQRLQQQGQPVKYALLTHIPGLSGKSIPAGGLHQFPVLAQLFKAWTGMEPTPDTAPRQPL